MILNNQEIMDPKRIRDIITGSASLLPHITPEYKDIAHTMDMPLVDAHDMQLSGMTELPQLGDPVVGYRFYRVAENGSRRGGVFNNYVAEGVEPIGHFWFSKEKALSYVFADIINHSKDVHNTDTYVLDRVSGTYQGLSWDEGFIMTDIDPNREEVLRITKNDLEHLNP